MKPSFLSIVVLVAVCGSAHDMQAKFYSILDLGTLGGVSSSAAAVNDSGRVAGTSKTVSGRDHAFLFDGRVMRDLGTLDGADRDSYGNAINKFGQVAGTTDTTTHSSAFFTTERPCATPGFKAMSVRAPV